MKRVIAAILIVCTTLTATAQVAKKTVYKTYTNKKGISMKYPATWEQKYRTDVVFFFMRPVEAPSQRFRENANLMVGDAQDLYLGEYAMDARKKMPETLNGYKEIASEYIKLQGMDCYRLVYEFKNSDLTEKCILYLLVKNDKAYSLTFAALNSTFDRFMPLFESMANTLKIP